MIEPLWKPSRERVASAALTEFRIRAQQRAGRALPDYDALHAWSVGEPEAFWALLAEDAAIPFVTPPTRVRSDDPMPRTRWFEGATLSYARALLYPGGSADDSDRTALIGVSEAGDEVRLDRADLRRLVARIQAGLRRSGVRAGDAVAAYAANLPETVALMLACSGMGVLFASCSPDFGQTAAESRFAQLRPKLLFATTAYRYGGKRFDTSATVAALAAGLPGLADVVALPYPNEIGADGPYLSWGAWLPEVAPDAEPETVALPFDHPLYVLFSSGTTGVPKAMVHRAGGVLLTHHKEHRLHGDVRAGDVVLYYTTCGWMMWNWLVSALAEGATVVLYEGSPAYPDAGHLWSLAERLGITFFGTSARFLHTLQAQDARPMDQADLSSVRTLASTGSPLSPAGFRFVYERVKRDVHLASVSGGTDIVSCFMLGVPTLPVYAGQIQRPGLGVDLAVFDEDGTAVDGQPGEMVCRQALPSMPLRFLDDPEDRRYRAAYFEVYPGAWRHGDLIERTPEGGIIVYGRSDATLNPGGVRIGTAEVYRPLEALPEVNEAVAVGKRHEGDEEIWLLVSLRSGVTLDDALASRIRTAIRQGASPRHVPRRIVQVPDLPRTRSGKLMEIAVRHLVNDQPVPNVAVAANPESLDRIREVLATLA